MTIAKLIRAAIGIVVVVALGIVVMNWWTDFQAAPRPSSTASTSATGTASAVSTETAIGTGVVQINGVNFRKKPSSSAKLIRGLKAGEKVTVLLKDGQWYKVEDSKGQTGWVTATGDYVMIKGQ